MSSLFHLENKDITFILVKSSTSVTVRTALNKFSWKLLTRYCLRVSSEGIGSRKFWESS